MNSTSTKQSDSDLTTAAGERKKNSRTDQTMQNNHKHPLKNSRVQLKQHHPPQQVHRTEHTPTSNRKLTLNRTGQGIYKPLINRVKEPT
jgi:hypothetical protein